MPIRTKRWDEPIDPTDGTRILITRYRPRALPKAAETWSVWMPKLAPSPELLKAFQGKERPSIGWAAYRIGYLKEMREQTDLIAELSRRSKTSETITLLCSASCLRGNRCHRTLLKALIDAVKE